MNIYWVELEVIFFNPMPINDENSRETTSYANGFFQEIGCTSNSEEEAKQLIGSYLCDLAWFDLTMSQINYERIGLISEDEIETEIYGDPDIKDSIISNPLDKGIWYLSGKAFYSDTKDDEYFQVEIVENK